MCVAQHGEGRGGGERVERRARRRRGAPPWCRAWRGGAAEARRKPEGRRERASRQPDSPCTQASFTLTPHRRCPCSRRRCENLLRLDSKMPLRETLDLTSNKRGAFHSSIIPLQAKGIVVLKRPDAARRGEARRSSLRRAITCRIPRAASMLHPCIFACHAPPQKPPPQALSCWRIHASCNPPLDRPSQTPHHSVAQHAQHNAPHGNHCWFTLPAMWQCLRHPTTKHRHIRATQITRAQRLARPRLCRVVQPAAHIDPSLKPNRQVTLRFLSTHDLRLL